MVNVSRTVRFAARSRGAGYALRVVQEQGQVPAHMSVPFVRSQRQGLVAPSAGALQDSGQTAFLDYVRGRLPERGAVAAPVPEDGRDSGAQGGDEFLAGSGGVGAGRCAQHEAHDLLVVLEFALEMEGRLVRLAPVRAAVR